MKIQMGRNIDLDVFGSMLLDTDSIGQDRLNISGKERSNLFTWNGQFSPQLIEVLLRTYSRPEDLILDPFLGSGTVLCEAARLGLPCFGTEINPAAFKMAQTYRLINAGEDDRKRVVKHIIERKLHEALPETLPLLTGGRAEVSCEELQGVLTDLASSLVDERARLLLDTLIVLLDFHKGDLTLTKIFTTWDKLKATVKSLPFSESAVGLSNADARALPLPDAAVDLVVTSPPYINVFNYHQQYRTSMEALGWDLLKVAHSEIGSNRKHRANRFLTVIQYCLDMADVLAELRRVCKPGARIIVVVGRESNVRKTRFYNGHLVAALGALCAGLKPGVRQERVFKNKFGILIHEEILHFTNDGTGTSGSIEPLVIAKLALNRALEYAPDDSKADLIAALEGASDVSRSPIYVSERTATSQPAA
jgi:SAM-dependent methyltransferase